MPVSSFALAANSANDEPDPDRSGSVGCVMPAAVVALCIMALIYVRARRSGRLTSARLPARVIAKAGLGAVLGSMLGSPFPPAVYIGHPGWKAVGGRIGYSLATGIAIALVCFLGLTALLLALIPLVAILPILLYIGLVIGAQAFQATPANHAPAVVLAIIPNTAEWAKTQVDGALAAAGTSAATVGAGKLAGTGVLYGGMEALGGGSVLAGMVLGAVAAFIIDGKLKIFKDGSTSTKIGIKVKGSTPSLKAYQGSGATTSSGVGSLERGRTGALVGARLRNLLDLQHLHFVLDAVPVESRDAGVNHVANARHGKRCLRNVGGENHATTIRARKNALLVLH